MITHQFILSVLTLNKPCKFQYQSLPELFKRIIAYHNFDPGSANWIYFLAVVNVIIAFTNPRAKLIKTNNVEIIKFLVVQLHNTFFYCDWIFNIGFCRKDSSYLGGDSQLWWSGWYGYTSNQLKRQIITQLDQKKMTLVIAHCNWKPGISLTLRLAPPSNGK